MNSQTRNMRILRIRAVMDKIGVSRSTIYDWLNPNSKRYDLTFPKQRKLGKQSIGWMEADIDEWLLQRKVSNN